MYSAEIGNIILSVFAVILAGIGTMESSKYLIRCFKVRITRSFCLPRYTTPTPIFQLYLDTKCLLNSNDISANPKPPQMTMLKLLR